MAGERLELFVVGIRGSVAGVANSVLSSRWVDEDWLMVSLGVLEKLCEEELVILICVGGRVLSYLLFLEEVALTDVL